MRIKPLSLLIPLALVVLTFTSGIVAGHRYIESDGFRTWLGARLSQSLGRETTIGSNLDLTYGLPPQLHIQDFRIANPEWAGSSHFLSLDNITLAPRILPLLTGNLIFEVVQARGGTMWLEQGKDGAVSWPAGNNTESGQRADRWLSLRTINRVDIKDFTITSPGKKSAVAMQLKLDEVTASDSDELGQVKIQAQGSFNGQPLNASWQAAETLWFLGQQNSQLLDLKITLAESDISGRLEVDRSSNPPRISGDLQSHKIIASHENDSGDDKLIPALAMPTAWLDLLQADINWNIERLDLGAISLRQFRSRAQLQQGRLQLDPIDAMVGEAPIHLRVASTRSDALASLRASGELDDLDLSENIDWLSGTSPGAGFVDIRFVVDGVGDNLREVAATLNGNLQLVMEQGQVSDSWLQKVTSNLSSLITPWSQVEGKTPIRCLALRLQAKQGQVDIEQMVLDTRTALILGDGHINLDTETAEIILSPDSHSLDLLTLQLPIRVSGALTSLQANLAPTALITRSGVGILRNIANVGGLLGKRLEEGFDASSKGCQASLHAYRNSDGSEDGHNTPDQTKTGKTSEATP